MIEDHKFIWGTLLVVFLVGYFLQNPQDRENFRIQFDHNMKYINW